MAKNDIDNSISANDSDAQNFYQDDKIERKSVAWLLTATPTPTAVPAPATTPQVQQAPVKTKLTNTGPGNILSTFVAITTLATLLHYAYNRRRLQA